MPEQPTHEKPVPHNTCLGRLQAVRWNRNGFGCLLVITKLCFAIWPGITKKIWIARSIDYRSDVSFRPIVPPRHYEFHTGRRPTRPG
jgi:hypothetical protein